MRTFIVKIGEGSTTEIQADYFEVGSFHNATFYRFINGNAYASNYLYSVASIEEKIPDATPQREQEVKP